MVIREELVKPVKTHVLGRNDSKVASSAMSLSPKSCVLRSSLPADFTSDAPFHLDDIRGTGEAESAQNPLAALQLVHLQDGPSFLQLLFGSSNICRDLKHGDTCTVRR